MIVNEYKFDTEENRAFSIRHLTERGAEGFRVTAVENDSNKTLVTLTREEDESVETLPYQDVLYITRWYVEGALAVLQGYYTSPSAQQRLRQAIQTLDEGLEACKEEAVT